MTKLEVPIIVLIVGEGASGGALGIGVGDKVMMLENTWYSVISPESCSSILWRSWEHKEIAASALKLTAKDMKKMKLIDDYGGKDEPSVIDNNSSAFVSRKITNAGAKNPTKFSYHAYGLAIDINPKINPFVECEEKTKDNWVILENSVIPKTATQFLDRNQKYPGIVHKDEFCYNLFISKGWSWGGNWTTLKDWQHFQKDF